jgi:hypothetical protein
MHAPRHSIDVATLSCCDGLLNGSIGQSMAGRSLLVHRIAVSHPCSCSSSWGTVQSWIVQKRSSTVPQQALKFR